VSGPCALVSGTTFSSSGAGTCVVQASGAASTNFNAASANQNVIIAKAAPTITFGAAPTPTYLGGNFTVAATTTNTDSTALTYSRVSGPCALVSGATFSSSGAGTCVVQASGAATTNFNAASANQNVIIAKATPTITWSNPADIVYGTALGATQLNATASVPGSFTYTPASGTVLNAGSNQNLHVDFTPTDTANYNIASKDVKINVTKRPLTASITAASKIYDGNTAASITCSLSGVVSPDVVTCSATSATFADKNVGIGKTVTATGLSLSGAAAGNYTVNATATTTADITATALTVSATGVNKVYDGNTTATVTLSDNRVSGDVFTIATPAPASPTRMWAQPRRSASAAFRSPAPTPPTTPSTRRLPPQRTSRRER